MVKECGSRCDFARTGCIFDVISGNYFASSCINWLQKSTARTAIGFIRIPCGCRSVTRLVQTNPSNAGVPGVRLTTEWVDFYKKNLLGLYFGYNTYVWRTDLSVKFPFSCRKRTVASRIMLCLFHDMNNSGKVENTPTCLLIIKPTRLAVASQFCKLNGMDGSSSPVHTVDE